MTRINIVQSPSALGAVCDISPALNLLKTGHSVYFDLYTVSKSSGESFIFDKDPWVAQLAIQKGGIVLVSIEGEYIESFQISSAKKQIEDLLAKATRS